MRMNWNYIAGFFDGEGSLTVYQKKKDKFGRAVTLAMSQKPREVLEQIKLFLSKEGCKAYITKPSKRNINILYMGSATSVLIFCNKVKDRTIVKKDKIIKAIKELSTWKTHTVIKPRDVRLIHILRQKGFTMKAIAKRINRSESTVHYQLNKDKRAMLKV